MEEKRMPTGIEALDKRLEGGFPVNTNILVSGGPGSGKTLFGLNFVLEGARKGQKCCYISLNETKEDIIRACENVKSLSDFKKYVNKNLKIANISFSRSITLEKFVETLEKYPEIDRIAVDNVNKLLMFAESSQMYRRYLTIILEKLKEMKSSLLLCETKKDEIDTGRGEAFECGGVINLSFLEYEEKPIRMLTIYKMRFTDIEPHVPYEFVIDKKKIYLGKTSII